MSTLSVRLPPLQRAIILYNGNRGQVRRVSGRCPNDFVPGLGGWKGAPVVPVLTVTLINSPKPACDLATRDWHPASESFQYQWWPLAAALHPREPKGAQFHPALNLPRHGDRISRNGSDEDGYSAFLGINDSGQN